MPSNKRALWLTDPSCLRARLASELFVPCKKPGTGSAVAAVASVRPFAVGAVVFGEVDTGGHSSFIVSAGASVTASVRRWCDAPQPMSEQLRLTPRLANAINRYDQFGLAGLRADRVNPFAE